MVRLIETRRRVRGGPHILGYSQHNADFPRFVLVAHFWHNPDPLSVLFSGEVSQP